MIVTAVYDRSRFGIRLVSDEGRLIAFLYDTDVIEFVRSEHFHATAPAVRQKPFTSSSVPATK